MADRKTIPVAVNGDGVIGKRVAAAVFSGVHLRALALTPGRSRGSGGSRRWAHVTLRETVKLEVSVSVWWWGDRELREGAHTVAFPRRF